MFTDHSMAIPPRVQKMGGMRGAGGPPLSSSSAPSMGDTRRAGHSASPTNTSAKVRVSVQVDLHTGQGRKSSGAAALAWSRIR